jgi:hypothetical protein
MLVGRWALTNFQFLHLIGVCINFGTYIKFRHLYHNGSFPWPRRVTMKFATMAKVNASIKICKRIDELKHIAVFLSTVGSRPISLSNAQNNGRSSYLPWVREDVRGTLGFAVIQIHMCHHRIVRYPNA